MSTIALSIAGDTVGDVIYRYFESDSDALEAQVYALNPHLNSLSVILPSGTRILLPEQTTVAETKTERVVTRWD